MILTSCLALSLEDSYRIGVSDTLKRNQQLVLVWKSPTSYMSSKEKLTGSLQHIV